MSYFLTWSRDGPAWDLCLNKLNSTKSLSRCTKFLTQIGLEDEVESCMCVRVCLCVDICAGRGFNGIIWHLQVNTKAKVSMDEKILRS